MLQCVEGVSAPSMLWFQPCCAVVRISDKAQDEADRQYNIKKDRTVIMIKKTAFAAAIISALFIFSGCVPTQETVVQMGPDLREAHGVDLDFTQLHNDTIEAFGDADSNPYSYIADFNIEGDNEKKYISFAAIISTEADKAEAEQFAAAALRHCNDAATTQSSDYEMSDRTTFGKLYNDYSIRFVVIPSGVDWEETDKYLMDMSVNAGEEIPLSPDIETYEDEWEKQMEVIRNNLVYDVNGNIVSY